MKRPEEGRGKGKGERERNEAPPRGAEGQGGLYPDIHRTLFFILHYPCSTPLYSIMPTPRINDESVPLPPPRPTGPTRREPPYVHQVLARRPLPRLCAINTPAHGARRLRLSSEKGMVLIIRRPLHNPHQTWPGCMLRPSNFDFLLARTRHRRNYECV